MKEWQNVGHDVTADGHVNASMSSTSILETQPPLITLPPVCPWRRNAPSVTMDGDRPPRRPHNHKPANWLSCIVQHLVPVHGRKPCMATRTGPAQRSVETEVDTDTTGDNAASRLSRTRTISYWCGAQPLRGGTRVATRIGLAEQRSTCPSRCVHHQPF